jgi:RNA polymerase sigma-70 factor (family 1)
MAIKPLYDEADLLQKIAKGDEYAFKLVYDQHKKKIYHYAMGFLHSELYAEEVLQEVFLKIWLMRDAVQSINSLEAYLKTLTRNRSLDTLRKMIVDEKFGLQITKGYSESHNETEEAILLNDTRAVLNHAINMLPQQQREVYLLCQNEGLKYEEVAARLNISVNTVKTHMKRALAFVRLEVSNHTDIAVILILLKLL